MIKKCGFTMVELIITIGVLTFLMGSISWIYLVSFRSFNSGEDRVSIRTPLSQAMESMTRDIYNAQAITVCNATTLTFYADLGSGASTYSYILSGNNLKGPTGAVKAIGIQPQGTSVSWGTTPALFTCSNGVVTIDMTAVNNGETVHIKSDVKPRNIAVGLVAWWKFDEGSGSTAVDSSGNGNAGTLNNSPTWTTGQIGSGALILNGSSQSIRVAHSSSLNVSGTITVSAWIKVSSHNNSYREIVRKAAGSYGWFFLLNTANKLSMSTASSNQSSEYDGGYAYAADNAWHMVTGTFDGSTIKLYMDGVFQTSLAGGALNQDTDPLYIGSAGSGQFFGGSIDDVRIYNRVLSAHEIEQLYEGN